MSYARFSSESDVYVFASVAGGVECCGCIRSESSPRFFAREALLAHLRNHRRDGHAIPEHLLDPATYDDEDFA